MSMIKCPECGKDISDKAKQCPNCGYELNNEKAVVQYVEVKTSPKAIKVGMIMMLIAYVVSIPVWLWTIYVFSKESFTLSIWGIIPFQYIPMIICTVGVICTILGVKTKDPKQANITLIVATIASVAYIIFGLVLSLWDNFFPPYFTASDQCCFVIFLIFPIFAIMGAIISWIGTIHEKTK